MENKLRQTAKELIESGQVKLVIGYETGSTPFKCTPLFAQSPEDADRLVWNPSCVNNLAVYLPHAVEAGKVAVVVKPCDAKSVVELIKENKISREDVMTIVVPCPGVLDANALRGIDLRDVRSVEWRDGSVVVTTGSGETKLANEHSFLSKCLTCDLGDPTLADVKLGEQPARGGLEGGDISMEEYERLSPAERRDFWARQFSRCIRCYACRGACPGCYCNECFVDKHAEIWISKATDPTTNWFFHTTRAMHIAGRCIGCGECERACPMGIPPSLLNKKLDMDVEEMFGTSPGEDPEALPILGSYQMSDPDPCPEG